MSAGAHLVRMTASGRRLLVETAALLATAVTILVLAVLLR